MTTPTETRLIPIPFAEWDDETRHTLLAYLRRPELYLSGAPDAPPMPIVMELFANHVPLSETFLAFSDMLAGEKARLDPKLRELLILRVAWRTGSGYEWNQHSRIGGDEGISDAQLRAVRKGRDVAVWSPLERALLTAVDEMIDGFAVSEETWNQLSGALDAGQLLELLFVVGGYLCLATVLNSAGLRGNLPADKADKGSGAGPVAGTGAGTGDGTAT